MPTSLVHTCVRVRDVDASLRFYRALGFEERGRLNFASAYNVYLGLPGDDDRLELTINVGREQPYELGDGYNHVAVTVEDIDAALAPLAEIGVQPEKPPYIWVFINILVTLTIGALLGAASAKITAAITPKERTAV